MIEVDARSQGQKDHPMRLRFPLMAPLLILTACGSGDPGNFANRTGDPSLGEMREFVQSEGYRNFERPDGTFDRADYRRINMAACSRGLQDPEDPLPPEAVQRFCTCLVDRLLLADDNQLRAIRSDRAYGRRAHGIVMRACEPVLEGRPPDQMVAPEGEASAAPPPAPR